MNIWKKTSRFGRMFLMKVYLSNHHCLTTICGIPYLLPYGQGIADFERQIKLNESAAELWSAITELVPSDGMEVSDIAGSLSDVPKEDMVEFIDSLIMAGALLTKPK